jgi:type 1 fimbria pilin
MKKMMIIAMTLAVLALAATAFAHTPLCDCFDNGDGTVSCEGGFSDGSSATGVKMYVKDGSGKVLQEGAMNADSEFGFNKPEGAYTVLFDAGEGHQVEINGTDIVE